MKCNKIFYLVGVITIVPLFVFAQDNGNLFNLVWADPDQIVGASYGYFANYSEINSASMHNRLQVIDYDKNDFKEIVGWDHLDEHYFVIENTGDDSFELKRFFDFFPYFIDLNDDGINEAIHIDTESDPDSVIIQLVKYDAGLESFIIDRDLGKFIKPTPDIWGVPNREYLDEYYIEKDNYDNDPNTEFVIFAYDRWADPSGGRTTHLVVFELTSTDVSTAGIKIEHLETITENDFQCPATIAPADFDNDGIREMVMVSIEAKKIIIYESSGEDQYERVYETTTYAQDALHTFKSQSYIGDLDGDGLDDIWFGGEHGALYVIPGTGSYETTFTYENSAKLMVVQNSGEWRGGVLGDCDADGKPNMYWWDLNIEAIFDMEYQGGDLRNPSNYIFTNIYQGDLTDNVWTRFDAIYIGGYRSGTLDIDNDGKRDFVIASPNDPEIGDGDWPRLYVFESVHTSQTDVEDTSQLVETPGVIDFDLFQNYPNPFNAGTQIRYELHKSGHTKISVFDIRGQEVKILVNQYREKGVHNVSWDGVDFKGMPATSGIYLFKSENSGQSTTRKMLLVR